MGRCNKARECLGYTQDTHVCDYSQDYSDRCFQPKPGYEGRRRHKIVVLMLCMMVMFCIFMMSAFLGIWGSIMIYGFLSIFMAAWLYDL